jgi:hypothetical protein
MKFKYNYANQGKWTLLGHHRAILTFLNSLTEFDEVLLLINEVKSNMKVKIIMFSRTLK